MMQFNFEKNLEHQTKAVNSTVKVFEGIEITKPTGIKKEYINPIFNKDSNYNYIEEEN